MAYFTAVLSPGSSRGDWRPLDVDVEAGSADELADALRSGLDDLDGGDGADGADAVLAVLEREDEWFALVRVDADVRVFVSDAVAAAGSAFAELFAELPTADDVASAAGAAGADGAPEDDDAPADDGTSDAATASRAARAGIVEETWAGDPELLSDLGCSAQVLLGLAVAGTDPSEATVRVGELVGFADVLESLR